ncbi:hypothetical protein BDN67DRAFT_963283 [Paxillus ammoniavirescens]|nr:hypothetical protein BDN67DRAFT_963283 [Paxillus ammoniavirescens]
MTALLLGNVRPVDCRAKCAYLRFYHFPPSKMVSELTTKKTTKTKTRMRNTKKVSEREQLNAHSTSRASQAQNAVLTSSARAMRRVTTTMRRKRKATGRALQRRSRCRRS